MEDKEKDEDYSICSGKHSKNNSFKDKVTPSNLVTEKLYLIIIVMISL